MSDARSVTVMEDQQAIMPLYGDEPACPFACSYCFASSPDIVGNYRTVQETPEEVDRTIREHLAALGDAIVCVFATRLHDVFGRHPLDAMPHIERLMQYRRHVSLLTKATLTPAAMDALQALDERHAASCGKRIVTEVSMTSSSDRLDLEPRAPRIAERLAFMKELQRRGMLAALCISPLLPSAIVPDDDLRSLIRRAADVSRAVTVGKALFHDARIDRRLGLDQHEETRRSFESQLPFGIGGTVQGWRIFSSPRSKMIQEYAQEQGLRAFHRSSDTVQYLAHTASESPRCLETVHNASTTSDTVGTRGAPSIPR